MKIYKTQKELQRDEKKLRQRLDAARECRQHTSERMVKLEREIALAKKDLDRYSRIASETFAILKFGLGLKDIKP